MQETFQVFPGSTNAIIQFSGIYTQLCASHLCLTHTKSKIVGNPAENNAMPPILPTPTIFTH